MGSILNTSDRIFSTFDGVCHQTFRAAKFDVLRIAASDSDDEEEYVIKRNKFREPIYGPRPAPYLNYIPIDCDAPIVVGRGFLHTIGSILNTSDRIFSTFDGVYHQTFRAAKFDVLRTTTSDSDDEEEYTLGGRGGESFWEGGDDFGVEVLRFHTCLTDILGFLEKLEWWFEQDIDKEEERFEGDEDGGEV
ncbi:hypothetical protein Tco_1090600 [Tanacetum coccineum]|uniref:Uncharacterized protein n=1 Tax=Tanacetum coccineum TaxID=301880 RepID=A0ABQ5I6J4_9ASTR